MVMLRLRGASAKLARAACALIMISTGCQALPEIQWEGQRVNVAADDPEAVCTGSYSYLDSHAVALFERIGLSPDDVDYYLLDDVQGYCEAGHVGCSDPGVVYSEHIPHLHELVHAREGDGLPLVLEEGLATRLGDLYPIRTLGSRARLREQLGSDPQGVVSSEDYGRAAHFVTFLSETYGLPSVLALDTILSAGSDPSAIDEAFELNFGAGLDEVLDEYENYPDCDGIVDVQIACQQEPLVLDALTPSFEQEVDCSAGGLGPRFNTVYVEQTIELQPTIDGGRIVQMIGEGALLGGVGLIRRCGPCTEGGVLLISRELEFYSESELPSGRYVVQLMLPSDAPSASLGMLVNG